MALAQCIQAINKRREMRICNLQYGLRRRVGKKIFIISLMCFRPVQERFFIHMEWHQISCKGKMTQFEIIVKLLAAFSVQNLK